MIQTIELMPGVTLRCFPDTRFKQGCLSVQLVRPMCREEAAMNALIPAVLLRGTVNCPDLRSITLRLDDLYGAALGALVRRIGDYQTTGLFCNFIDDKYALQGDQILRPMVAFLKETLLQPLTEDGGFRQDFVESEKKNLISTIESQRNDKRAYAAEQMMRRMCSADSFGLPRLGEKEQVAAITARGLYAHYQRILQQSAIALFYVGSAPAQQVADLLREIFREVDRDYINHPAQTPFRDGGCGEYEEELDVTQARLCMGFTTPVTLTSPDFAAMQVFNTVFGAGMTSKLFMQVRETQSLCYDIGSGYHGSKGIVTVYSGIDSKQKDHVQQEVLHQLQLCKDGQISSDELTAAKQSLLSQLQTTHDSPGSIEGYYATAALSGLKMTPAEYMQAVQAVSTADVSRMAASLQVHTVYFLKGVR